MSFTHGTTTGYSKHRCKCDACRAAWRDYQRAYMHDHYHGRPRTVSTLEARHWIAKLCAAGWTHNSIAKAAGVDHQLLRRIASGQNSRARRVTIDKILGVMVSDRPEGVQTPAAEAVVMLDAIRSAGVPVKAITDGLKVTGPARLRRQQRVQPATRRKLVLGYRYLASKGLVRAELLEEVNAS